MKFGVPWSVKGIRPEARETAREAARRSGMSLGDWLNTVILHQAAADGIDTDELGDDEDGSYGTDLSTVHERLDDISRRIDKVARSGPAAYAPTHARSRARNEPDQLADLINRLDRRLDEFAHMSRPPAPTTAPVAPPGRSCRRRSRRRCSCRQRSIMPSRKFRRGSARSMVSLRIDLWCSSLRRKHRRCRPLPLRRARRCRPRTCRGWSNSYAPLRARSRRCANRELRKRSTPCAANSARSPTRSPKPCRGTRSTPSNGRSRG